MELNAEDVLTEELSWYTKDLVQTYQKAGEKPDRVIYLNPHNEGLQIIVMPREKATGFFQEHADQFSKTLRSDLDQLYERLKTPLPAGCILLVLDGLLTCGWVDFQYATYLRHIAETPKYTAPKVPGIN